MQKTRGWTLTPLRAARRPGLEHLPAKNNCYVIHVPLNNAKYKNISFFGANRQMYTLIIETAEKMRMILSDMIQQGCRCWQKNRLSGIDLHA